MPVGEKVRVYSGDYLVIRTVGTFLLGFGVGMGLLLDLLIRYPLFYHLGWAVVVAFAISVAGAVVVGLNARMTKGSFTARRV